MSDEESLDDLLEKTPFTLARWIRLNWANATVQG